MNKSARKSIFFLIFFIFSFIILVSLAAAAETCPIGLVNDTAPGSCGLYTDTNTDNLCDLSQNLTDNCDTNLTLGDLDSTQIKSMTVEQVAEYYKIEGERFAAEISKIAGVTVKKSDSFQMLHDNYGVKPAIVREIATSLKNNSTITLDATATTTHLYNSLWVALLTILLYLTTWFLSYKEKISKMLHRKIWNWLLLITFIPVFITSLFWLLRIDYGIILALPFNITFWHVEFGIVMVLISIFHIFWHTQYYVRK